MMKILILGLCFALAASQDVYSQIKGVWTTAPGVFGPTKCRIDAQFFYRNYLAYNTGPDCNAQSIGIYAGTYAIGNGEIYLHYAAAPVPIKFIRFTYTLTGDTLTMTADGIGTINFNRAQPNAVMDGVWDGFNTPAGPDSLRTEVLAGTYLNYNIAGSTTANVFGLISVTGAVADVRFVNVDATIGLPINTAIQFDYAAVGNGFSLTRLGTTTTLSTRRAAGPIDGTWVGLNNGAYETIEMNKGLYRVYGMGVAGGNTALMGTIDHPNATHLIVRFGYQSNKPDLKNQIFTFPYTLSGDGLMLTVYNSPSSSVVYRKAAAPPSAARIVIKLDATFDQWSQAKQDAYVAALASALGVSVTQIEVQSAKAGSVILDVVIVDDQQNGKTAAAAYTQLKSSGPIGGYTATVTSYSMNGASSVSSSFYLMALVSTLIAYMLA